MRHLLFIIFIQLFFIISTQTFSQNTYLSVSLIDDSEFTAQFNGLDLYQTGKCASYDNLTAGEHFLRITDNNSTVLFSGNIKLPANQAVYAVIDEYGQFIIYKKIRYENKDYYTGNCGNLSGETGHPVPDIKPDDNNYSSDCRYKLIKDEDYDDLKSDINNTGFSSTNTTIVKTAFDKNMFTSEQIKNLLMYFTFEKDKLEIAKYGYKSVCDKNNYFKIYDAFTFDSSVRELKEYIDRQK